MKSVVANTGSAEEEKSSEESSEKALELIHVELTI